MGPSRICHTYEVGIKRLSAVDEDRYDLFGDRQENRKVEIQLFYPVKSSDVVGMEKAEYVSERKAAALCKAFYIPSSALKDTKINAYTDVPMLPVRFPLILFSHGYNSFIEANTGLCTELAANGYIVASVGHAHEAVMSEYEDGSFDVYDKTTNKKLYRYGMWKAVKAQKKIIKSSGDTTEVDRLFYEFQLEHTPFLISRVKDWSADMLFALNVIRDRFSAYLDLSNGVGVSGHSLGGATAYYLCQNSDIVTCGLNIDGALFGDYRGKVLKKPFYQIACEENWNFERSMLLRRKTTVYTAIFNNMKHIGFSDIKFVNGASVMCGRLDPMVMHTHLVECHLYMFDRYLKGMKVSLNESHSVDVTITEHGVDFNESPDELMDREKAIGVIRDRILKSTVRSNNMYSLVSFGWDEAKGIVNGGPSQGWESVEIFLNIKTGKLFVECAMYPDQYGNDHGWKGEYSYAEFTELAKKRSLTPEFDYMKTAEDWMELIDGL